MPRPRPNGFLLLCLALATGPALIAGPRHAAPAPGRDYVGAIALDAADGKVLFEEDADAPARPASVTKLMTLLLVLEAAEAGSIRLEDRVTVTAEVTRMGGSQCYLKEHEVFTVDELLYGLMIQSGNDAALALALHTAGTREAFVAKMNERAAALGLARTRFTTPHGLVSKGQDPDMTTARDMAQLGLAVVRHPQALRYTGTRQRVFRQTPLLEMTNHNKLLWRVPGCDGLKTGYYREAGFSLVATAFRDGKRVVVAVMGSRGPRGRSRDAKAAELIALTLPRASLLPESMLPVTQPVPAAGAEPAGGEDEGLPQIRFPGAHQPQD